MQEVFGFYFNALDSLYNHPDSLEGVIVIAFMAFVLMIIMLGVPAAFLASVILYHVTPAIIEAIFKIAKVLKAVRKVMPIWACVFAAMVIWPVGMAFGAVGDPHHPILLGSFYTVIFLVLHFGGVSHATGRPKDESYVLLSFGIGIMVALISIPAFPWGVIPVIAITTAFWGLFALAIQTILNTRRRQHCRC